MTYKATTKRILYTLEGKLPFKDILVRGLADNSYITELTNKSITLFDRLARTRGNAMAISYFKRSRLHFTRFMCGDPLLEADGVAIDSRGLPKWMDVPKDKFERTSHLVPRILTLLALGRMVHLPPTFDPKPITDKWNGSHLPIKKRELLHLNRQLGLEKWDWK